MTMFDMKNLLYNIIMKELKVSKWLLCQILPQAALIFKLFPQLGQMLQNNGKTHIFAGCVVCLHLPSSSPPYDVKPSLSLPRRRLTVHGICFIWKAVWFILIFFIMEDLYVSNCCTSAQFLRLQRSPQENCYSLSQCFYMPFLSIIYKMLWISSRHEMYYYVLYLNHFSSYWMVLLVGNSNDSVCKCFMLQSSENEGFWHCRVTKVGSFPLLAFKLISHQIVSSFLWGSKWCQNEICWLLVAVTFRLATLNTWNWCKNEFKCFFMHVRFFKLWRGIEFKHCKVHVICSGSVFLFKFDIFWANTLRDYRTEILKNYCSITIILHYNCDMKMMTYIMVIHWWIMALQLLGVLCKEDSKATLLQSWFELQLFFRHRDL